MSIITIPNELVEKLGNTGAEALAKLLSQIEESSKDRTIEVVESRFEKRLAEAESRIIKWSFVFIFGQFWAIIGVLFAFFRH